MISSELSINSIFITFKPKFNIYQCIQLINQINELCIKYKEAMIKNELRFHEIKLKDCKVVNDVLFKKSFL